MAESWLSHNARLLGSLAVWPHQHDWHYADDEPVAAGLAAARSRATAAAARLPGRRAAVPLQLLVCGVPSRGHILCSLAGFTPHLTCLVLCVAEGWRPVIGCRAALASLTSLRELIIGGTDEDPLQHSTPVFSELVPTLQHLTRLTALDLAPCRHAYGFAAERPMGTGDLGGQQLHASHLQLLPASLVELSVPLDSRPRADEPKVDMGHLTAVTQLHIGYLQAGAVLPPNVEDLRLLDSITLLPLFEQGLPRLGCLSLECKGDVFEVPAAARLQQLSQVTSLSVTVTANTLDGLDDFPVLLGALPCLHDLHVHSLTVTAHVAAIASSCRQLTHLTINAVCEGPAVRALAAHLSQLTGLQQLHWTAETPGEDDYDFVAQPLATQADWQALCDAVVKLKSLRQVMFVDCELGAAAAKLGAATQLKQLALS